MTKTNGPLSAGRFAWVSGAPVFCNFVDNHVCSEKKANVTELLYCKVNYVSKYVMYVHKTPIKKCVYKAS